MEIVWERLSIRACQCMAAFYCCAFFCIQSSHAQVIAESNTQYVGVNIAGAEFSNDKLPGRYGYDYAYPEPATIDYFAEKGMNIIRIPTRWERLQHQLKAELDANEMQRLDAVVSHAESKGLHVIIDVHNYATYYGSVIGTANVPTDALADLWRRIALRYKDRESVIFGLMNEPNGLPTETWLEAANNAIAEIRRVGARNMIFVPGDGWSSARSWVDGHYGTANSKVMLGVIDPDNNFTYEVHQYFNSDFTGTTADCQNVDIGIKTLTLFTQWAREKRKRGFLGEFGAGPNPICLEMLDRVLRYMAQNDDVWVGWTYWAAGTRWPKDYFTNLQPVGQTDRPQMAVLEKYFKSGKVPLAR